MPAIITGHVGEDAVKLKGEFRLAPNYFFERPTSVAEHSPRWRERRAAAKESTAAAAELADVEQRWANAAPEIARLEAAIYEARQDVEGLVSTQESEAARWWLMADRGHTAGRTVQRFAVG